MDLGSINRVYFVGIGGIGMSALARFFNYIGKPVSGYDRTSTRLTSNLEMEGKATSPLVACNARRHSAHSRSPQISTRARRPSGRQGGLKSKIIRQTAAW